MTHLSEDLLSRIAQGQAQPDPEQSSHLQRCEECSAIVAGLMRVETGLEMTAPSPRGSGGTPVVHEVIGRYRVTRLLGEGAMGRVFGALDPELGRDVAIKVVRGASSPELRSRLLREAQTAARLKHPHIVTVYDAGTLDEEVFVAMELVPGGSVRTWLAKSPSWREVLRVFIGAGKGLAAVHDAGLVHRDFKPDNVLLDADGTARVSDFGLVGVEQASATPPASAREWDLTRTGTLMGTPAYMAPELFRGAPATPASDQFAFCVSLFEALAGERPFRASTFEQLKEVVARGVITAPSKEVPAWLLKLVRRGLSANPAERFASMHELVAALEQTPARRQRRVVVALGVGGALALVAASSFVARASPCEGFTLGDTWNDATRAQVSKALAAKGAPATLMATVSADLDAYARRWVEGQQSACQAARVSKVQTEAVLEQRVACLDQRRREFGALIAVLAEADEDTMRRAASLTGHLPALSTCADLEAVKSERPLPENPAQRAEVLAMRDELAKVFALSEAGHTNEALELSLKVDATLERLQDTPQRAESQLRIGQLHSFLSHFDEADTHLREAVLLATSTGQDRIAAKALGLVATNLAQAQRNVPELDTSLNLAVATLARVGNPDEAVDDLQFAIGSVREFQSRYADAEKAFQASLALRLRLNGPQHPRVATVYNALGVVHDAQGDPRKALQEYDEAERIWLATVGPMHPNLASNFNNKAIVFSALGEKDKALEAHARALEIRKTVYGPESRAVAQTLSNLAAELGPGREAEALERYAEARALYVKAFTEQSADVARIDESVGNLQARLGKVDEARVLLTRSLEVREKLLGPDHPSVGRSLHGLGDLLGSNGRPAEAMPYFQRAAAIFEKTLGPKHPHTGYAWSNLGDANFALAKWAEAARHYQHAIELFAPLDPPDLPQWGHCLSFLGQTRDNEGRSADARALLEEALTVLSKDTSGDTLELGQATSSLAQVLWRTPSERKRAAELGARALPLLEKAGRRGEKDLAAFKKWRATHP